MRLRILANLRVCNESNSSFTTASSSLEVEEVVEGVLVTVVVVYQWVWCSSVSA